MEKISAADLVVAGLSTDSRNVYYELGFALGQRKPTILITPSDAAGNLPSDLEGFLYLTYDRSNPGALVEQVRRTALVYGSGTVAVAR
jgi:predicted nucleotide-binding protein